MSTTYITRFDGVRVSAADYQPGMDHEPRRRRDAGGLGDERCRARPRGRTVVLTFIRTLHDSQEFSFAGPYGEASFLEDYTAHVRGQQLGNVVLVTRNADREAQHIVANYQPRTTLLLVSRLIGEHFADTAYGEHFDSEALE